MDNLATAPPEEYPKTVWIFEYETVIDPGNEHNHIEDWNCDNGKEK